MIPMRRVLVTGAAGFIGSHTSEVLVSMGAEVCGMDNLRTGHRVNLEALESEGRFHFEEIDLLDRQAFERVVRVFRPEAIVHLAALVSVQESMDDPDLNFRLNVEGVHRVGLMARHDSVRQVVYASSAATYGDAKERPIVETTPRKPISPYGAAKDAGEGLLQGYGQAYGFGACCFRYFNVYGPRQDPSSPYSGVISIFADRYGSGEPAVVFGDGAQTRDFVFVRDVAEINALTALREDPMTGSFNVCTGMSSSLLDLIAVFGSHFPDAPKPRFEAARKGDVLHSCGSPNRLKEVSGWGPKYSVQDGLGRLIEWLGSGNARSRQGEDPSIVQGD